MPSILLIDDHPIFRHGLKDVLSHQREFSDVGEAGDAKEAWEQLRRQEWDAVILGINLPGTSGLELLTELKRQHPRMPTLVLSLYPEDQYATRMLKAGASGYLTKDRSSEELVGALRKILRGEKYVSDSLAQKFASEIDKPSPAPHDLLSNREFEIAKMIAAGKPPRVIAKELFLSPRTINTYRARILQKLKIKNNAQLIQYVLQNNLFELGTD